MTNERTDENNSQFIKSQNPNFSWEEKKSIFHLINQYSEDLKNVVSNSMGGIKITTFVRLYPQLTKHAKYFCNIFSQYLLLNNPALKDDK